MVKKFRKFATAVMIASLVMCVTACGEKKTDDVSVNDQTAQTVQSAEPTSAGSEKTDKTEVDETKKDEPEKTEATAEPEKSEEGEDEAGESIEGAYVDGEGTRKIDVKLESSGVYTFSATWEVEEATFSWTFSGKLNGNTVKYKNGVKTMTEKESSGHADALEEYSDGCGKVTIKDGTLSWKDEEEDCARGIVFKKE
ncbi:hypothetical protein [Eubacterium xylanophilum]|uniref:hypothetical protein n=1 Tax=Eubacterium xylanophilum TaxID=39497 RepID=UPI00047DCD93|nr:hypothetical protein [Eubacterium xylanophilum]